MHGQLHCLRKLNSELSTLTYCCLGWSLTRRVLPPLPLPEQNTRSDTSLFYLFSNNYINDLITLQEFDAHDEEVLAYYISFLKTIR